MGDQLVTDEKAKDEISIYLSFLIKEQSHITTKLQRALGMASMLTGRSWAEPQFYAWIGYILATIECEGILLDDQMEKVEKILNKHLLR
jgi:predicted DNA-binding transcriptional regulator